MVPIDGRVREGVGLLGSPSFEIPRSVLRDTSLDVGGTELRRRLAAKNRHNLATLALALLVRWIHLYALTMLAMVVTDLYRRFGLVALVAEFLAFMLFTLAYFTFVERAATGFRPLRPRYCSIYDPHFWWHERFWKLAVQGLDKAFVGTPFKNIVSRLLGVRMGKKVFDDGCAIPEKTLATIGDHSTLNAGSVIQCHSQEDGAFKSDYSTIGSGCTIGVGALVHYGVTIGDGAVLAPDSFLMKGEQVPQHTRWGGNPAGEMQGSAADLRIRTPATPSSSPEEPWSWDLDGATLAARSDEPWSWDLDGAVLAAHPFPKKGRQVPQQLAPSRPGLTLVRRGVGAAAVLFLLGSAVVYYRVAPDFATAGSSPSTQGATPSGQASSAGPSPASDPRPSSSATTPSARDNTGSAAAPKAIQMDDPTLSAKPFETVRISGTFRGGADTFLRVQRREAGKWLAFPLPAKTDQSGHFTTYVDLGRPGRYQLRLLDPVSGVTSKPFVLVIRG
jgi:serine acetyltransferase